MPSSRISRHRETAHSLLPPRHRARARCRFAYRPNAAGCSPRTRSLPHRTPAARRRRVDRRHRDWCREGLAPPRRWRASALRRAFRSPALIEVGDRLISGAISPCERVEGSYSPHPHNHAQGWLVPSDRPGLAARRQASLPPAGRRAACLPTASLPAGGSISHHRKGSDMPCPTSPPILPMRWTTTPTLSGALSHSRSLASPLTTTAAFAWLGGSSRRSVASPIILGSDQRVGVQWWKTKRTLLGFHDLNGLETQIIREVLLSALREANNPGFQLRRRAKANNVVLAHQAAVIACSTRLA